MQRNISGCVTATLPSASVTASQPAPAGHTSGRDSTRRPVRQASERDALYAEFAPLVRRLIHRYGQTTELRQELPGEIYCRFCSLLESYDPARGVPLRPYLVRQLSASVYTFARQRWNLGKREMTLHEDPDVAQTLGSSDPTSEWDAAIMQEHVSRQLPAAITRLPLRQRQAVIWRYYEDRSFAEIAELMNIQTATARSLVRYALENLREKMAACSEPIT